MTDKKWLVPDVIDPAAKVCVQLEIPNDLKHIAAFWGALQELGKAWNWEDSYAGGSATAYVWQPIIENAAQQVRTGVNCMLDCDEVEDCLETSPIIGTIEGDIIVNSTDIITNETNITNNTINVTNILDGGDDTNVYPDLPTPAEPDALCGASHEIARRVIALVEQTVLDVGTTALAAWLLSWLGIGGWLGTQLSLFWDYILANEVALTGVDFDVYQDQVAEAFYCAELDRAQAVIDLDPAIPALRRDALINCMESPTDGQIALWAFVGSLDDTEDCSAFCPGAWCHEWVGVDLLDWTVDPGLGLWDVDHWTIEPTVGELAARVYIRMPVPYPVAWTEIQVDYDMLATRASASDKLRIYVNGGEQAIEDVSHTVRKTGTLTASAGGTITTEIFIRLTVAIATIGDRTGAIGEITRIQLTGTGLSPFSDNC